jgi:hypothetical protein
MVIVVGGACGVGGPAGGPIRMTNRGELKLVLPDAGMPVFEGAFSFGSVKRGESARLSFETVNTGADPLDIQEIRLEAPDSDNGSFFVQGGAGTVPVGVRRAYNVTFAPVREGAHTATLLFETNANAASAKVLLTGSGTN